MSVFNPGTNGDLKATNIVAAALEAYFLLDEAEKQLQLQQGTARRTAFTSDLGNQSATFSVTMPIIDTIDATNGRPVLAVQNYLGALGAFANGGGDLKSADLPSAVLEIANLLANAELQVLQNVAIAPPRTTTYTYNLEAKTVTLTSTVPVATVAAADGGIEIKAIDYLS
ncbi:MAG: hypothetical protein NVS2B14_00420 [Chamaesiphon sp.]